MKLSLPNIRTRRGASLLLIAILVLELLTYGGITYVKDSHSATVSNAAGSPTTLTTSTLTTTNASASKAATIAVPCGCKKQTAGQPGQTSTAGTSFQNGSSGSVQTPNCLPCQTSGGESPTTVCPEYACKAPTPAPSPTPTPTPPSPTCPPCGLREGGTTAPGYMCPMLCAE